jgi:hypothetical protein
MNQVAELTDIFEEAYRLASRCPDCCVPITDLCCYQHTRLPKSYILAGVVAVAEHLKTGSKTKIEIMPERICGYCHTNVNNPDFVKPCSKGSNCPFGFDE